MISSSDRVVVVGTWHLGSVYATCLSRVAGAHVTMWDQRESVKSSWSKGQPPIFEPGLADLVSKNWGKSLFWSSDLKVQASEANWMFLAYDTEIDEQDRVQLGVVEQGWDEIVSAQLKPETCFVFTSQLPVGTSRKFRERLVAKHPEWRGEIIYFPENLRLGSAIDSFDKQERVVLGFFQHLSDERKQQLCAEFRKVTGLCNNSIDVMSTESAEMVKHALNAFMGTCIVFANEVSDVCERFGANAWDVMASLKKDSRVGPKAFLSPGLGFAGGTIGRDVRTLADLGRSSDGFFASVYNGNSERSDWICDSLTRSLGSLEGQRLILMGVTYKVGTSTVRRSPAIDIGQRLKKRGASVVAIDPMADLNELTAKERDNLPFDFVTDMEAAFAGASAAILVTEWPQFYELNWAKIMASMKRPLIIDTKRFSQAASAKGAPDLARFEVQIPGVGR